MAVLPKGDLDMKKKKNSNPVASIGATVTLIAVVLAVRHVMKKYS